MEDRSVIRGRAFVDGRIRDGCQIYIRDGSFSEIDCETEVEGDFGRDTLIVPGFIDLHIHGGDGADFMDGTPEAVRRVLAFHARHGTTAVAATTVSAPPSDIGTSIRVIEAERTNPTQGCSRVIGMHLEGPFLNPDKCGAHPVGALQLPRISLVDSWLATASPPLWMMTIAPELDGARTLLARYGDEIRFAIGHTTATYTEALEAFDRGAVHATHLFNAMETFHHREPGVFGALVVTDDTTTELIADGVHVHPVVLKMAHELLPNRIALVSDAIRAAGLPDGPSEVAGKRLIVRDGVARTEEGALAGSTLTMARAVQNMVELAGLPIERVLPMATVVPARIAGARTKGEIRPGFDADLVILSSDFEVMKVFVGGVGVGGG